MIEIWRSLSGLALLTFGYWLVDVAIRRGGAAAILLRLGIRSPAAGATTLALVLAAAIPFWHWQDVPGFAPIRVLAATLAGMLAWRAATLDIDPVFEEPRYLERGLLGAFALGGILSPAGVVATIVLLAGGFALKGQHSKLPMRVLVLVVAYLAFEPLGRAFAAWTRLDLATLVFFVVSLLVSHYLVSALAKMWLGPSWYSWIADNRLHHLATSAYSWGWARFVPWRVWRRFVAALAKLERPIQVAAFGVELLAPLAILDRSIAVVFCGLWALFHLGVLAVSGLLFWEWIGTNLAVGTAILMLPPAIAADAFGPLQLAVAATLLLAFPLRHKLWKPMPLGWWDTPLTQRMHWIAVGESGRRYGIYNDYMCPNERLYGKIHACFMAPQRAVTYHLGEVWRRELRDAIRHAGPELEAIAAVRSRYGVSPRDPELEANHLTYLSRFFDALNRGRRKAVLPRGLRWLKAPGDQLFYWGELPAFKGQEPVESVLLVYREEYFDGADLVRLVDEPVVEVAVGSASESAPCRPEPSPDQLDELWTAAADGKIVDIPHFRSIWGALSARRARRLGAITPRVLRGSDPRPSR